MLRKHEHPSLSKSESSPVRSNNKNAIKITHIHTHIYQLKFEKMIYQAECKQTTTLKQIVAVYFYGMKDHSYRN